MGQVRLHYGYTSAYFKTGVARVATTGKWPDKLLVVFNFILNMD